MGDIDVETYLSLVKTPTNVLNKAGAAAAFFLQGRHDEPGFPDVVAIGAEFSERSIVDLFLWHWRQGTYKDLMPWSDPETDAIKTEQCMRLGRADLVLYHADGSATVVEAKNGDGKNYQYIASAIGQVSLYASQLATQQILTKVRRAILWSSHQNDNAHAETLATACRFADVTPINFTVGIWIHWRLRALIDLIAWMDDNRREGDGFEFICATLFGFGDRWVAKFGYKSMALQPYS